jgi:3-oxoacyl-[acyl-carrier protein] reductase
MNALITGGSRGIGKSISEYFNKKGINTIIPSRKELDLNSPSDIKAYVSTLPKIDILINNAGVNKIQSIEEVEYKDLLETFNINFFSSYLLCSALLPKFKKQNYGRIINISSIWGTNVKEKRSTYAASKTSVHNLTKQLVPETIGYNVLSNTISPGYISTDLTYKNNNSEEIKIIENNIPLNRMGTPEEISKLTYYLTIENSYINGQEIIIDGGFSCQ